MSTNSSAIIPYTCTKHENNRAYRNGIAIDGSVRADPVSIISNYTNGVVKSAHQLVVDQRHQRCMPADMSSTPSWSPIPWSALPSS